VLDGGYASAKRVELMEANVAANDAQMQACSRRRTASDRG
jgi:hypothetical protein